MLGRILVTSLGTTGKLSESDIGILLKYLARDRQILIYDESVVKLAGPNGVPSPISEEDRAIASLKSLMSEIEEQICLLESRILALREKSKKAVEMGHRTSALAAIRSKRSAETALSTRTDTLSQLEEVYKNIEQAADQVTVLRVTRDATKVLRDLNSEVGSVQAVTDVLDDWRGEVDKAEDINLAINQAGVESNAVYEHEVEEELEALRRQSQSAREEKALKETKQKLSDIHIADSNPSDKGTFTALKADSGSSIAEEAGGDAKVSVGTEVVLSSGSQDLRKGQCRERNDKALLETG
ncbi:MAG: hypothetical protein Q9219_007220 [cf. Caloplaca sp. 3 TL-2023]